MTSKDTNPKDAIGTAKWRQFFVVPRQVLWEVGVGMLEGALKYGRHNYRGAGVRASVYCDAALGHIEQFIEGEDIDRDSGLSHVTKAICSLVVLRDAMLNDFWTDDRPPKIKDLDGLRDRLQELVAENFDRHADKNPHHYSHEEDGAPYYDADGTAWHGVNVDDAERAVMRSDLFQELVQVERGKQRARTFEELTDLGYWNASVEDFEDEDIVGAAASVEERGWEMAEKIDPTNWPRFDGRPCNPHQMGYYRRDGRWYRMESEHGESFPVWQDASDEDEEILAKAASAEQLAQMRRQFEHAQSSASITPPILGLSSHALALLDDWRIAAGNAPFTVDTPQTARALALRQWAIMCGILEVGE
ncbi:MAG TPA: dATP/dGTP diphosphohydrolase domain-containing protein [Acidimicrobiia bacterium]